MYFLTLHVKYRKVRRIRGLLLCESMCSMLYAITEKRNFSEIQKRKCKYCIVDYHVNITEQTMLNVVTETRHFPEIQKRECKYSSRSLEANRIEQVGIFTVLSRTVAIGSVRSVGNTVG